MKFYVSSRLSRSSVVLSSSETHFREYSFECVTLTIPESTMPPTLDALLASLEAAKSRFGRGAASEIQVLLDQLSSPQLPRRQISYPPSRGAALSPRLPAVGSDRPADRKTAEHVPRANRKTWRTRRQHVGLRRLRHIWGRGHYDARQPEFRGGALAGTPHPAQHRESHWDDYEDERAMGSTWLRFHSAASGRCGRGSQHSVAAMARSGKRP